MGRAWYDEGKMMKKKNTFNDYIDVAQYLVDNKYTSTDKLVAQGGSAGGLLMGVITNMRPDLFRAVVADVPFVDVINTMRDASIPLTAQEWEQWGNPNKAEHYAYMKSYSPYDNIERKSYPWILATTSLNDSQVGFWEPAKWVAKLRAMKTDTNPLYIKINMAGGHGGSSGRYDVLRERAFRYAFMLDAVGMGGSTDTLIDNHLITPAQNCLSERDCRGCILEESPTPIHMTKVEMLEREIAELAPEELAIFREWFAAFDAKAWDRQLEADAEAGKLNTVAESALNEYRAGKTRPL